MSTDPLDNIEHEIGVLLKPHFQPQDRPAVPTVEPADTEPTAPAPQVSMVDRIEALGNAVVAVNHALHERLDRIERFLGMT